MRTIVINNPGPQGSTGPQGVAGPSGSTQPFNNVSGSIWATTSSLQVSGSFLVSGSSTFTNIGPAIFSGSTIITGPTTMSSAIVSGDVTVLGTASINVLQINTTINSTGSNTLGDNANDTQTLYGAVVIPTGSLTVSGSVLFGTSSAGFFWDNTNSRLGVGTASPAYQLSLAGSANIQGVTGLNFLVGTRGIFFGLTNSTEVSTYLATSPLIFSLNQGSTPVARFSATNGNFLINTTTDAGYKLDVNGTARVVGQLTVTGSVTASGNLVALSYLGDPNVQFGLVPSSGVNTFIRLENTGLVTNGILFNTNNSSNSFKFKHDTNFTFTLGYQNTNAAWFGSNTSLITVNASAQLQIDSTTKGFLPPRTATTASIASPAQGLMTYLTGSTNEGLYYYNSGSQVGWHKMLTNTGSQSITGSLTVSGVTTFAQGSSVNGSGNLSIGAFAIHSAYGYATFSQTTLLLTGGTFTSTTGNQVGLSFGGGFTPTSGTATYSAYSILPTINQTGGANGITRGLFIDPTLTAAANFRAIETTSGSISFNHGSTPLIFASTNGNVGIGTGSAAAYKFQVRNGDIALDFNRFLRGGFDNNWSTINLYNGSTGDMEISLFNQSWYLRHNANATFAGNVGVGLTGSISPRLQVRGSGTTSATTALRVENTNASASLVVLDNGFVGINTGSAAFNLDVNGSGRFVGNITAATIGFANNSRTITFSDVNSGLQYQGFGGHRFTAYNISSSSYVEMITLVGNQANLRVGINSTSPNASAILDVASTSSGFLPPRMTNAQRVAISTPAVGLMVYCTDATEGLYIYKSTGWTFIV
jgi:hypothetical protein